MPIILLSGFTLCVALVLNNSNNGNAIPLIFISGLGQASVVFNHDFIVSHDVSDISIRSSQQTVAPLWPLIVSL